MNFGTCQDEITNIAEKLTTAAGEIESTINNIYSQIESLNGNGWSGQGYDEFAAECNAYKSALSQIPGVLKDFATFFKGTAMTNSKLLHTAVDEAFKEIEGA